MACDPASFWEGFRGILLVDVAQSPRACVVDVLDLHRNLKFTWEHAQSAMYWLQCQLLNKLKLPAVSSLDYCC